MVLFLKQQSGEERCIEVTRGTTFLSIETTYGFVLADNVCFSASSACEPCPKFGPQRCVRYLWLAAVQIWYTGVSFLSDSFSNQQPQVLLAQGLDQDYSGLSVCIISR